MTAGRSPGEQAAADRPAGHDVHQQTAAEVLARLLAGFHAQRFDQLRLPDRLVWLERAEAVLEHMEPALAAAEQRGRDDEKRKVRELADVWERKGQRVPFVALRRALADRGEATT